MGPGGSAPLSFVQQGLWFTDRLGSEHSGLVVSAAFEVDVSMSLGSVRAAAAEVAARHESLRTTFPIGADGPRQQIHPPWSLVPEVVRAVDQNEPLPDAEHEPPWRIRLTGPTEQAVVRIDAHHLIVDGRSMRVWIDELRALLAGVPASDLPAVQVQYPDFARWERTWIADERNQSRLRRRAELVRAAVGPPPIRPDLALGQPARATQRVVLSATEHDQLMTVAQQHGVSPFTCWLTIVAAELGRRATLEQVAIGAIHDGRTDDQLSQAIGCYAGIMVILLGAASGHGSPAERAWSLESSRQSLADALDCADLPFSLLVEQVDPPRRPGSTPLTQVGLSVSPDPVSAGADSGASEPTPFDLHLDVQALGEGGAAVTLTYRADLYSATAASALLEDVVEAFGRFLDPGNDPVVEPAAPVDVAVSPSVLASVQAQCAARPADPAVIGESGSLTYAQLWERTLAIGQRLQRSGVRREDRVGVLLSREVDLVPAILGIWWAGGTYVPLDPSAPLARVTELVERSAARIVLTDADSIHAPGLPPGIEGLRLDQPEPEFDPGPDQSALGGAAYIMFTSGSTGRPKGVVVEHTALAAAFAGFRDEFGLAAADCLLAVTPIGFDISLLELLLPLTVGGRVVVASRDQTRDGQRLIDLAEATSSTVMQATPATWRMLLAADTERRLDLRVLCGGEALAPDLARQLTRIGSQQWNLYGPTEATIWASAARLHDAGGSVDIGRPLTSAAFRICDEQGHELGPLQSGELQIAGPCLARGYLDDQAQTDERFVWSGNPAVRWYRTGDLARRERDGRYVFLGRADGQVKVRGHRVELAEVESALRAHPLVEDAMAAVRRDPSGENQLIGYVVSTGEIDAAEVRRATGALVPDYLVPSVMHRIGAIPLTPNGKVDRRPVPAADLLPPGQAGTAALAPATGVDADVLRICAEVLGVDDLTLADDFVLRGGHSLLVVHLLARLRNELGAEVTLGSLFADRTVTGIARNVRDALAAKTEEPERPALVKLPRG